MYRIKYYFVIIISLYIFILNIVNVFKTETTIISFFDSLIWNEFFYFYINSIKANNISNFISYSYDKEGVKLCRNKRIICKPCLKNKTVEFLRENTYQSTGFLERMFIRNEIIMSLLENGLSIIISDIDIIYLKNPVDYMTLGNHNIAVSLGDINSVLNGGLLYLLYYYYII